MDDDIPGLALEASLGLLSLLLGFSVWLAGWLTWLGSCVAAGPCTVWLPETLVWAAASVAVGACPPAYGGLGTTCWPDELW